MDIINYSRLNKDNEILIPKNSIVGKSDSILIRKEDDLTFSIYDLIEYKKILEKIKQESEVALFCGNIKRKEFFDEYIKKLSFSVLDVIRNHVKDMYDIEDRVLVCDGIDHIKVFKNDENKKEYEKRLINIFK